MTPSDLKHEIESRRPESRFFSRENMRFLGDTMRNYGVRKTAIKTDYNAEGNYTGRPTESVDVWELFRKRPVKCGVKSSAFFACDDFRRVFPSIGEN